MSFFSPFLPCHRQLDKQQTRFFSLSINTRSGLSPDTITHSPDSVASTNVVHFLQSSDLVFCLSSVTPCFRKAILRRSDEGILALLEVAAITFRTKLSGTRKGLSFRPILLYLRTAILSMLIDEINNSDKDEKVGSLIGMTNALFALRPEFLAHYSEYFLSYSFVVGVLQSFFTFSSYFKCYYYYYHYCVPYCFHSSSSQSPTRSITSRFGLEVTELNGAFKIGDIKTDAEVGTCAEFSVIYDEHTYTHEYACTHAQRTRFSLSSLSLPLLLQLSFFLTLSPPHSFIGS
ncbi:unnamed protein product [Acanthosepion pharaonis]|uniref:Uncharacterized protein n=1 Tax=Acanthosepion pharaonis TaxID=158019 RepID=A0A812F1T1_ACAPH|nr:unnamed protein product [Sepia pharaonis]